MMATVAGDAFIDVGKQNINPKNPWSRTGSRSGISQSGYQRQRQKSQNQENSPDQNP